MEANPDNDDFEDANAPSSDEEGTTDVTRNSSQRQEQNKSTT